MISHHTHTLCIPLQSIFTLHPHPTLPYPAPPSHPTKSMRGITPSSSLLHHSRVTTAHAHPATVIALSPSTSHGIGEVIPPSLVRSASSSSSVGATTVSHPMPSPLLSPSAVPDMPLSFSTSSPSVRGGDRSDAIKAAFSSSSSVSDSDPQHQHQQQQRSCLLFLASMEDPGKIHVMDEQSNLLLHSFQTERPHIEAIVHAYDVDV